MTKIVTRHSTTAGARPATGEPGELYVNLTDSVLGFSAEDGTPIDLPSATQLSLLETDIGGRMRWRGTWVAGDYLANDVVIDANWLAVANKDTKQRPAPLDAGHTEWTIDDAPAWEEVSDTSSTVTVGLLVTPQGPLRLSAVRVWTRVGYIYDIYLVPNYNAAAAAAQNMEFRIITSAFVPKEDGWATASVPTEIYDSGEQFAAFATIAVDPSVVTPTSFSGRWDYQKPGAQQAPADGRIEHAGDAAAHLMVAKLDNAGTDQSTNLATVGPGATVSMGSTIWTVIDITDAGTYMDITVSPAVQASTTGPQDVVFDVPVVSPLTHVQINDEYADDPSVFGFTSTTGIYDAVPTSDAYGVDMETTPVSYSEDWDLMAYSGGSGGSAGGGGGGGAGSIDLAADYDWTGKHTFEYANMQFVSASEAVSGKQGLYAYDPANPTVALPGFAVRGNGVVSTRTAMINVWSVSQTAWTDFAKVNMLLSASDTSTSQLQATVAQSTLRLYEHATNPASSSNFFSVSVRSGTAQHFLYENSFTYAVPGTVGTGVDTVGDRVNVSGLGVLSKITDGTTPAFFVTNGLAADKIAQIDHDGGAATSISLLTKNSGDVLYVSLTTGGIISGSNGTLNLGTNNGPTLISTRTDYPTVAINSGGTALSIDGTGQASRLMRVYDTTGAIAFNIDANGVITGNMTLLASNSLVNRTTGDSRYATLTMMDSLLSTLVSNGVIDETARAHVLSVTPSDPPDPVETDA